MNTPKIEIIKKRDDNILVRIYIQGAEVWDKEYTKEKTFTDLFEDYKSATGNEIPSEIIDYLKTLRNAEYSDEQLLLNYFTNYEETNLILGEKNISPPNIIGKPFSDPFTIFEFMKRTKSLKASKLEGKDLFGLEEDYGPYSAYCNGDDKLYISGGEKEKKCIEKFWKIDLNNEKIECYEMLPKKNHSMIVIPGNYVFIVGGQTKETFYFDHESNNFYGWKSLNKKRAEPGLILVNNFLYCFDNVNSLINFGENNFTFEKTDLNGEKHEWELISPNMDIPNLKLNQKFFGVVQKDDDILFIGGNMDIEEDNRNGGNERKNYKLNIISNKIEESDIPFIEFNLREKTFLPYNDNVYYIFPDFNKHHPEVVFYLKNKNTIKLIKYKVDKDLDNDEPKKEAPPAKPDYDFNQPKNLEKVNIKEINPINTDENNIKDKEINQVEKKGEIINDNMDKSEEHFLKPENEDENNNNDNNKNKDNIEENNNKDIYNQGPFVDNKIKYISINNNQNSDYNFKLSINNNNNNNDDNNNNNNMHINMNPSINNNMMKNSLRETNNNFNIVINEEKESDNILTENLELLKDKLVSSKMEDIKESQNKKIESDFNIKVTEEKKDSQNGGDDLQNKQFTNNDINIDLQLNLNKDEQKQEESNKEEEQNNINNQNINIEIKTSEPKIEEKKDNEEKKEISKPEIIEEEKKEKEEKKEIVKPEIKEEEKKEESNFCETGIILGDKNAKKLKNKKEEEQKPNTENKNQKNEVEGNINIEVNNNKEKNDEDKKEEKREEPKKEEKEKEEVIICGMILGSEEKDEKIIKYYNNKYKDNKNEDINKDKENKENKENKIELKENVENKKDNNENNINVNPEINIEVGSNKLKGPTVSKEEMVLNGNHSIIPSTEIKNDINLSNNEQNNNNNNNPSKVEAQIPYPNLSIVPANAEIKGNVSVNREKEKKTNNNSNTPEIVVTDMNTPIRLPGSTNENMVKPFDINVNNNQNVEIKEAKVEEPKVDVNKKEEKKEEIIFTGLIIGTNDPKYDKNKKEKKEEKQEGNKTVDNIKAPKFDMNGNIVGNDININNNKKENNEGDYFLISGVILAEKDKDKKDKDKNKKESNEPNGNNINVEIKENNEENNKGGNAQINLEDIKIITQKDDSNKNENGIIGKKNVLPGVGVKNDNFVVSKAGEGENIDEININVDNLKSVSVGINGQKTGNRVDVDN